MNVHIMIKHYFEQMWNIVYRLPKFWRCESTSSAERSVNLIQHNIPYNRIPLDQSLHPRSNPTSALLID